MKVKEVEMKEIFGTDFLNWKKSHKNVEVLNIQLLPYAYTPLSENHATEYILSSTRMIIFFKKEGK